MEIPDTANRLLKLVAEHMDPNTEVDTDKLLDVLGFTSMQQLALLKGINQEFGVNLTPEDFEAARGKGGLMSLLPEE